MCAQLCGGAGGKDGAAWERGRGVCGWVAERQGAERAHSTFQTRRTPAPAPWQIRRGVHGGVKAQQDLAAVVGQGGGHQGWGASGGTEASAVLSGHRTGELVARRAAAGAAGDGGAGLTLASAAAGQSSKVADGLRSSLGEGWTLSRRVGQRNLCLPQPVPLLHKAHSDLSLQVPALRVSSRGAITAHLLTHAPPQDAVSKPVEESHCGREGRDVR